MVKHKVTKEYFQTINSRNEKIERRTYPSGNVRCFIWQGNKWWAMSNDMFEVDYKNGIIIEDTRSAFMQARFRDYKKAMIVSFFKRKLLDADI